MFPDKPAINVGKDGRSVSSMRSGISDAVNKVNDLYDTERQTGETNNG